VTRKGVPEDLPARVDVVVIGSGIAGVTAAATLASGGAKVLGLEARPVLGDGFSGRSLGRVSLGLDESPFRIASALGDTRARELFALSQANRARLAPRAETNAGGAWIATRAQEAEDIVRSHRTLERLGFPTTLWTEEQCQQESGYAGSGPGWYDAEAFCVDPGATLQALAQGVTWRCGEPAVQVDDAHDGLEVRLRSGHTVHAEFVIVAAGTATKDLMPSLADCFTAVRESWITAPIGTPSTIRPFRGGQGYLRWRDRPTGQRVVGGLRWAVPHLSIGDTDDATIAPQVRTRLESTVRGPMGLSFASDRNGWSAIACHTCDGLPIVGAIPGQGRKLVCAGWAGADWAFAHEAAYQISQSILSGKRSAIPAFLSPARLLE